MKMARKKKKSTFCAAAYAVIAAFVLIFTNNTSAKYSFHDHEGSFKHGPHDLHDHEREEIYTHTHTHEDGTTDSHKHHHDHCTKLTSPIIGCLHPWGYEYLTAISAFLSPSWAVYDLINGEYLRELLRPPILA